MHEQKPEVLSPFANEEDQKDFILEFMTEHGDPPKEDFWWKCQDNNAARAAQASALLAQDRVCGDQKDMMIAQDDDAQGSQFFVAVEPIFSSSEEEDDDELPSHAGTAMLDQDIQRQDSMHMPEDSQAMIQDERYQEHDKTETGKVGWKTAAAAGKPGWIQTAPAVSSSFQQPNPHAEPAAIQNLNHLIIEIKNEMQQRNLSTALVAAQAGVKPKVLSEWLDWRAQPHAVDAAMGEWLRVQKTDGWLEQGDQGYFRSSRKGSSTRPLQSSNPQVEGAPASLLPQVKALSTCNVTPQVDQLVQKATPVVCAVQCDRCESWYTEKDFADVESFEEAKAAEEWKCGICLGTHKPIEPQPETDLCKLTRTQPEQAAKGYFDSILEQRQPQAKDQNKEEASPLPQVKAEIELKRGREWSQAEFAHLKQLVEKTGPGQWDEKAAALGTGRSGNAVEMKWARAQRGLQWSNDEKAHLARLVEAGGVGSWEEKAFQLGTGRTAKAVSEQFFRSSAMLPSPFFATKPKASRKPSKGDWSEEETSKLAQMVKRDGPGKWAAKALELGTGRSAAAVQSRWQVQKGMKNNAFGKRPAVTSSLTVPPMGGKEQEAELTQPNDQKLTDAQYKTASVNTAHLVLTGDAECWRVDRTRSRIITTLSPSGAKRPSSS